MRPARSVELPGRHHGRLSRWLIAACLVLPLATGTGAVRPVVYAASYQPNSGPSNLHLTGLESTIVANWTPSTDPSVSRQVVTVSGPRGELIATKVLGPLSASADANDLETGSTFTIGVRDMDAAGNLSAPLSGDATTMLQAPIENAAFFDNFDAPPMDNLPSGFRMGDLDPNYYDVRSSDSTGDLQQFSWARQTFQHERHYHTLVIGSQGEAGLIVRPRVPVDLSNGRTATFEFEADLPPGQHAHGKWFEIYLVDAAHLPSDHEQLTLGGSTSQWPNSVEFDVFQSAQSAGIQGNNLPQISVNVNGTITTANTYLDESGVAIDNALRPQYSPLNVRVPIVLKVSQTAAQMFINGRQVATLSGFQLPYTLGAWELLHTNYRSALFDYTGFPKPATMTQQLVHWETLQFDGPPGSFNPLVRTYIQPGCRGALNVGGGVDGDSFEGCGPFLTPDAPTPSVSWAIDQDVGSARSGRLLYSGGGVSRLTVSINGKPPILLPSVADPSLTTILSSYALQPSELAQLQQGANTLTFSGNPTTIYGLAGLELEIVYNRPRVLDNPPQGYGANLRLTADNLRFDYLPTSGNPTWQGAVQSQTAYLYNGGGLTENPYTIKVANGPIDWLSVSTPAGSLDGHLGGAISGMLAPPTQGGDLLPIHLTVDFDKFSPGGDPSLGQPGVLEIDGGPMPIFLAVLAVKGGSETPNVIPADEYVRLYQNTYNACGGDGTLGVPGYEAACTGASAPL